MKEIPHSRPTIDDAEIAAVSTVLRSQNIAQGRQVSLFEEALSRLIGVREAVATSSGTASLHLALFALDIGENDEVVIPSFVCTALLNAVRLVRAVPVIADINSNSFNIDVHDIRRCLTKRTKAVIVPHMFGLPADIREIVSLGVPVIEDCAQSIGSRSGQSYTGSFGVLSVFSFYATKVICTGEGGMVAGSDSRLLAKIRDFRDYDEKGDWALRYNYKLTDMQAAMGLTQLSKLPGMIRRRREIAALYDENLRGCPVILPSCPPEKEHIYFRYVLRTGKSREVLDGCRKKGISCRRPVFEPLHHCGSNAACPEAEAAFGESVSIPIYPSLGDPEAVMISETIREILS